MMSIDSQNSSSDSASPAQGALASLRFNADGLVAAIAQDFQTGDIVMQAWMNALALAQTLKTRQAVFWSRSRQALWKKGERSGMVLQVQDIYLDCDGDALVLKVEVTGGIACHTGRYSCFYRRFDWASQTWKTTLPVLQDPAILYASAPQIDARD